MSKRLHASLRAVNKGRNLRPRSSQVPLPPPESSSPSTAPSADLRAKETVREPVVTTPSVPPPAAPSARTDAEPPAPEPTRSAVALKPAEGSTVSPVQAALAAFTGDSSEKSTVGSEAPDELATTPSSSVEDAKAAEPAKVEQARVEQAKAATKAEPPKVEVTAGPAKAKGQSPKVEPAKSRQPDAKQDAARDAARVDLKKVAPAKTDDRTPPPSKKGEPARSGDKTAARKAEPPSRRPGHEEDLDASSISAEFFRKDQDSVPPVEEHDEIEAVPHLVLSPTTLARRARLRRIVAAVVAFAGVVSIAVVGKAIATGKRQVEMPPLAEVKREATTPDPKPASEPKPGVAEEKRDDRKANAPKADAKPAESAKADDAKPADTKGDDAKKDDTKPGDVKAGDAKAGDTKAGDTKAGDAKAGDAKAGDAKADDAKKEDKPAVSAADVKALKKETESLLNRGKNKDAIEKAKELIAADPTDASGYLFMGAALQETGKWKDGIESYCECVRNATKGPINECRAMGGHK